MGAKTVLEREQHVQRPCGGREHSVFEGQRGRSGAGVQPGREKRVMSLKRRTRARSGMAL